MSCHFRWWCPVTGVTGRSGLSYPVPISGNATGPTCLLSVRCEPWKALFSSSS